MEIKSKKSLIFFIIFLICLPALGVISAYIVVRINTPQQIVSDENKKLFAQYIVNNNINKVSSMDDITQMLQKLETENYEVNSNISVNTTNNMLGSYDLNKMSLEIQSKGIPSSKLGYTNAKLKYASNDIISFQEIKDDNKFAIKSDDIVVKYVGVNLDNIKNFLPKLGFTSFENFPSNFDAINVGSFLAYDKDFVNNRLSIYLQMALKELSDDKFSSQKNIEVKIGDNSLKADAYSVVLSEKDIKNIKSSVLNDIIQDDDVINFLLEKINFISQNKYTNESLKSAIQTYLAEINNGQMSENEKVKISIYVYKGNVVKIRGDIYDSADFEIDLISNDNSEEVRITFLKKDKNGFNAILNNDSGKKMHLYYGTIINGEISKKYELDFNVNGNINSNSVKNDIVLSYKENEESTTVNIENEIKFDTVTIDRITDENCLFIDTLSNEDFEEIKSQLFNQIIKVYKEKMVKIDAINHNLQSTVVSTNSDVVIVENSNENN